MVSTLHNVWIEMTLANAVPKNCIRKLINQIMGVQKISLECTIKVERKRKQKFYPIFLKKILHCIFFNSDVNANLAGLETFAKLLRKQTAKMRKTTTTVSS